MPINRWIDKDVVYLYREILLNHSKNEIMPFASIDGPRYYHTKWSNSDTERQTSYDMAHMWLTCGM